MIKFTDDSPKFLARVQRAAELSGALAGEVLLGVWQRSMSVGPHTGRLYKRTNAGQFKGVGIARGIGRIRSDRRAQAGGQRGFPSGFRVHRASAPGETPAVDFGDLRRDLGVQVIVEQAAVRVRVGPRSQEIADRLVGPSGEKGLEFGNARVAARPSARPALATGQRKASDAWSAGMARQLKG